MVSLLLNKWDLIMFEQVGLINQGDFSGTVIKNNHPSFFKLKFKLFNFVLFFGCLFFVFIREFLICIICGKIVHVHL